MISDEPQVPPDAAQYLTVAHPRLLELRKRYAAFQQKVSMPIVWTNEYVQSLQLQFFRGDNCYVWQARDRNCAEINYCLTAYYARSIDVLGVLEKNQEDGLFGVHAYAIAGKRYSRDLLDSVMELHFLEKHLQLSMMENLQILDIGAGYGRLASRAANVLANLSRYYCTDAVPESTFLSEYHIRFRHLEKSVTVVPLDEIEHTLQTQNIQVAVNIHSFSECSLDAIEWWISLLADAKVQNLFIVPNASEHGGEKLALNSGEDFSHLLHKYGYALSVKAPKYEDPMVQKYGVSPTFYYLFYLNR